MKYSQSKFYIFCNSQTISKQQLVRISPPLFFIGCFSLESFTCFVLLFFFRNIDPRVNVLEAEWSPFEQASWMMPLIVNLTSWRSRIEEIFNSINENRTDENFTSAIFVADFPGK